MPESCEETNSSVAELLLSKQKVSASALGLSSSEAKGKILRLKTWRSLQLFTVTNTSSQSVTKLDSKGCSEDSTKLASLSGILVALVECKQKHLSKQLCNRLHKHYQLETWHLLCPPSCLLH